MKLNSIRIWIKDKLRGFSDDDIKSLWKKLRVTTPGIIIPITNREAKVVNRKNIIVPIHIVNDFLVQAHISDICKYVIDNSTNPMWIIDSKQVTPEDLKNSTGGKYEKV